MPFDSIFPLRMPAASPLKRSPWRKKSRRSLPIWCTHRTRIVRITLLHSRGVDIDNDEDFFSSLGIQQNELVPTCDGSDAPQLKTFHAFKKSSKKSNSLTTTVSILTRIDDDEEDEIDEYFSKNEQDAFAKAAKILEATGTVVGATLIPDPVTKIVFLVGKVSKTSWGGVLTMRIDT